MNKKQLYPNNWADEIRPKILMRDKYKCQRCKVAHRDKGYYDILSRWVSCDEFMLKYAQKVGFKVKEIILQVHHKNGNRSDNSESNLISLCPRCHMIVEHADNRIKRLIRNSSNNNKI